MEVLAQNKRENEKGYRIKKWVLKKQIIVPWMHVPVEGEYRRIRRRKRVENGYSAGKARKRKRHFG